jgi:predicted glycosyltransferase
LRIWVDCTAAAHPLVLRPVIERLEGRGHEVMVTAREYGQTLGILERLGIPYTAVGSHGGASVLGKGRALAGRSARLTQLVWERRPQLAIAHGSVDLAVVSSLFRIPSAQMQDYEFAGWQRQIAFRAARKVLVPDSIPLDRLKKIGARERKLVRYPGLKEEYYLADFEPDAAVLG